MCNCSICFHAMDVLQGEKMKKITPETAVKKEIKNWLNLKGWFHFHILQGLGAYPGIPDRIAIKDGVVLFIEIKSKKGTLSDKQHAMMRDMYDCRAHYVVARGYEDIESYLISLDRVEIDVEGEV